LVTFSQEGGTRAAGLLVDDRIISIAQAVADTQLIGADLIAGASVLEMLRSWESSLPMLEELAGRVRARKGVRRIPLGDVRIHAPVDLPAQIFCTGANYRKHVVQMTVDMKIGPEGLTGEALQRWAENMMDERARSGDPYVFTKPVSAIAGAYDPLKLPSTSKQADWELELGVIIGKGGWRIPRDQALRHVAGYAIVNDISARDLIPRTDYRMLGTDWLRSKGQPGFLPFGPCLVPAQFVPDPQNLRMKLCVNDRVMQDESTADMLFDVARQIEYISRYATLLPGDLICTGSPAGNGTHYNRYLQPGDTMYAEIEGLGQQRVTCFAAESPTRVDAKPRVP
jgi:2-keto-4-pentenoate hydratase/2-oxohepta-3-ene-1,7-dioic acid hydratase in catechol pathway